MRQHAGMLPRKSGPNPQGAAHAKRYPPVRSKPPQESLDRRRGESGGPPTRQPEDSLYGLCGRLLGAGADGNDVAEGLMGHQLAPLNRNGVTKLVQVGYGLFRENRMRDGTQTPCQLQ